MTLLAADLFCGLGGWTEGLLAEGWHVRGYDIEEHVYGDERYPGEFVLRDILQMHGSEIADVDLIVSSSPCQAYSYMAMPWTLAKAKAAAIRADESGEAQRRLNELFDAQFRIQREASEAAGRYIPMVVENVRGARPWVSQQSGGHYGSYYLWGDVPSGLPKPLKDAQKVNPDGTNHGTGSWFAVADSKNRGSSGKKAAGFRFSNDGAGSFQTACVQQGEVQRPAKTGDPERPRWFNDGPRTPGSLASTSSSSSSARKAASAKIAKIPFALSSYIARYYSAYDLV